MSRIADALRKVHEHGDATASDLPGGDDPLALKRLEDIAVPWRLAPGAEPPHRPVLVSTDTTFEAKAPGAAPDVRPEALPPAANSPRCPTTPVTIGVDPETTALVEALFGNGTAVASQSAARRIVFAYLPGMPAPSALPVQVASRLAAARSNRSVGLVDLDCSGQDALSAELGVNRSPGFADVVLDNAVVEGVAHPIPPAHNLRFIAPGAWAKDRRARLLSPSHANAGHGVVNAFDYVIAVAPSADLRQAAALVHCFDGTVLVVDPRLTTADAVKWSADELTREGIRVLGAVLDTRSPNWMPQMDAGRPGVPVTSTLKYVPAPFR
jgi:hypothetical protein